MSTMITNEQDQEATPETAFEWNEAGVCVNPEWVAIEPVPRGSTAGLWVAQDAQGEWWAGWQRWGRGVALATREVVRTDAAGGYGSRAGAINGGVVDLLESLEPDTGLSLAVQRWRAAWAGVELAAAVPEPEEPERPLPGICHVRNEHGVFEDPEVVIVGEQGDCRAVVRLACAEDGRWFWGIDVRTKLHGVCFAPGAAAEAWGATRDKALLGGLRRVELALADDTSRAAAKVADVVRAQIAELGGQASAVSVVPAAEAAAPARSYRTEFLTLPVARIVRNPANHRKVFDGAKLAELAASLKAEGLHQPIAVRALGEGEAPAGEMPLGDAPAWELIFGERRWRAAQLAGLAVLPCRVYAGLSRDQARAIALVENLQRVDVNALEEAEGYAELMLAEGLTQTAAAARVGRPRSTVANALRLLRLPEGVREWIRAGKLTAGHGIALARFVPKVEAEVPQWAQCVTVMAEEALAQGTAANELERGVPSVHKLVAAGLAVRIWGWDEHPVSAACRKHPAYFRGRDADEWVCLHPPHWAAEVARQDRARAEKEAKAAAEAAKREGQGKAAAKLRSLAELNREDYREFEGEVKAPLLELVPAEKREVTKDFDGRRRVVVTDVELADRLAAAMMRAVRKDRRAQLDALRAKVVARLAKLKRVGEAELAWLVWQCVSWAGRHTPLAVDAEACEAAGVTLPPGVREVLLDRAPALEGRELATLKALALVPGADLVRVLVMNRLEAALEELVEQGPESTGAVLLRWWLGSDTLWLLEETEEGRAELVEQVKAAPWYRAALAGEPAVAGEEGES